MTVKQLKQKLEAFPENMEVMVYADNINSFTHHGIESLSVENVSFREDPEGPALVTDDILVIKLEI